MARLTLDKALEFYPAFTQEDIAMLSDSTIAAVRAAIKAAGLQLAHTPSDMWRTEVMLEDLTQLQIAKKHNTELSVIKAMLYGKDVTPRVVASHQQIINFMAENPGKFTQVELAKKFNVSQSLIAKLNPHKKPVGPIERKTPGERLKIMEHAKKHSIQSAALTFNVSRMAIYRWMEKDRERKAGNK